MFPPRNNVGTSRTPSHAAPTKVAWVTRPGYLLTCTHSKGKLCRQSAPGQRPGRNLDPGTVEPALELGQFGRKLHFLTPNEHAYGYV